MPGRLRRRLRTGWFALAHAGALLVLRRELGRIERLLATRDLPGVLTELETGRPLLAPCPVPVAVRLVTLTTRLSAPGRNTCLRRALLLYRVLVGWGLPAEFVLAAGKGEAEGNDLGAHAWVTLSGTDLLPGCPAGYRELWRHGAPGPAE
jgi:hypothetical protein